MLCSKDLDPKFLPHVSGDVRRFFEVNPNDLNASILDEMTSHLPVTAISCDDAIGLRRLISLLDPRKEDEESWMALNTLCKLCAHSLAHTWEDLDIEKCVEEFTNPRIEGDFKGGGRLSVMLLAEALRQAKIDREEDQTKLHRKEQLISNLRSQQATLNEERTRLQMQSCRTISEKDARISQQAQTISNQTTQISKQEKVIAEQKAQITKQKKITREQERQISEQEKTMSKQAARIEALEKSERRRYRY